MIAMNAGDNDAVIAMYVQVVFIERYVLQLLRSKMGAQLGWLGSSAKVYVAFLRELLHSDFNWIVLECVQKFPHAEALAPCLDQYHLEVASLCPSHLGFPVKRPRKYMMMIKKDRLTWHPELAGKLQHVIEHIFYRDIRMVGDQLARAPEAEVRRHRLEMASQRGLPAFDSKRGKLLSGFLFLTRRERQRLRDYEAKAKIARATRSIFNISQSAKIFRGTTCIPTLLRNSRLWSGFLGRAICPMEHFEFQGYPVFNDNDADNMTKATVIKMLGMAAQRSLAGNGMHSASIGISLLLLLSGTDRVAAGA